MLALRGVPLFSQLSDADFAVVEACAKETEFPVGARLCRCGDPGRRLYVLVSGAVRVETGAGPGAILGPGQVIGELSILSGQPVSASVTALRPVKAYAFDKDAFLRLLQTSHVLHRSLSELLVERVLKAPSAATPASSSCVVIVMPDNGAADLARVLFRRVRAHEPRALYCEFTTPADGGPARTGTRPAWPFDCPESAWAALGGDREFVLDPARCPPADAVSRWREADHASGLLVLALHRSGMAELKSVLGERDALILIREEGTGAPRFGSEQATWGGADLLELRLGPGSEAIRPGDVGRWGPRLDDSWRRQEMSADVSQNLDLVVRWALRRSVGLALGAGAARGLAHLGVLEVLEREGVPFDSLAGTSIGGIVALAYGLSGSADGAIGMMRAYMGRKDLVLDRFKTYFSSYYPGTKIRRSAEAAFGGLCIEQLRRPVSVVAADLMTGEKVVLDRGLAASALLATSAIPGIFPPVERDGRLLFDGASVSRVPVDLLDGRRCALKIAVNVAPQPRLDEASVDATRHSIFRFMGFRNVWMRNWEVQAYWDGVKETTHADILIEPDTAAFGMFDFDRFDELLELGRRVAEDSLPAIRSALELAVIPGGR